MLDFFVDRKSIVSQALVTCTATVLVLTQASFSLAETSAQPAAAATQGEPAKSSSGSKAPKRTTINFEDQLIEGRTQKPELFVLLQNRMNNSRRLFKLRENFLPEMRKTAEDVGKAENHVRGGTGSEK